MRTMKFTKMVASGNDFVVIEKGLQAASYRLQVKKICDRKYGVGADGVLLLEKSLRANVRMRIFNADGSEAEMCGNGARCTAYYWFKKCVRRPGAEVSIETKAGLLKAVARGDIVKIKLTDPAELRYNMPLVVSGRKIKVNFINTGVPHVVIFVQGVETIDVFSLGREIRFHKAFSPRGANVNFVEVLSEDTIKVRTYERGVEDETLACGTGSVASALIWAASSKLQASGKINVITKGGEKLSAYFNRQGERFRDVWLEGVAKIVYTGELVL